MKKTTQLKNLKIQWIERKINAKYDINRYSIYNINLKLRREERDKYISEIIKYKRGMCEREILNNIYDGYCVKDDRIKDIYLEYKKKSYNYSSNREEADELYKLLIEKQKENYKKDILNSLEITEDEMNEGLAIVLNFCEKNNIWI